MPPGRKPSLTPLIQPTNQSTQCDFDLKETSSKAVQNNPFLRNAETQTKPERFKNTWTQTIEKKNVPETRIANLQTDYIYSSNKTTQCDFHLKITHSIETQTNPLKRKFEHSGDKVTKRLKLCQDESFSTSTLDLIYDYISKLELTCIVLKCMKSVDGMLCHLEVTRSDNLVTLGNYHDTPIRMFFTMDRCLTILKPFKKAERKQVFRSTDDDDQGIIVNYNVIDEALKQLYQNLVFCPGIPKDDCENFKTKKLEKIEYPFTRHQSINCPVFYTAPNNVPKEQLKAQSYQHQCGKCRYLKRYILEQKKKRTEVTPRTHLKRRSVLSRCRISVLTPRSRKKRFIENRALRFRVNKRIKELEQKLEESSLELNLDQHRKMQEVIASINTNGSAELEKVFQQASEKNHILGIALKKSWNLDTERNGFLDDQMRCEKGSKGNRWSPLTYRIALSVFSRSPAAYEALASFDILKLPSVYSLRNKIKDIPSKQGIDLIFLQGEAKRFEELVENYPGKNKPPKEGVLIYDEVKIIGKLMWNSSNNEFIGCCIDPAEYPSMDDLFKENTVSETLEAEYVLQYLWRCVSSKFDIIGPYFMLPKAASNSFLINTTYDVIWAFQCVGLETSALVCDGGTSNIAALRHMIGLERPFTYSENENGTFNFRFKPSFQHPFLKGRRIFWIVCPTHQLKNMINALNHSKDNDSKEFTILGDIVFGWSQIVDLYEREVDRRDSNELVQVKGLILAFIEGDPWVKLNVTPAKIMQTQKVLGELFNYANPMTEDPPEDRDKVMACHDYLFACHKIFEKGLLAHEKVESLTSAPVKSMLQGLEFFESWATERILCEEDLKEKTGQKFLAWQTWELLRISIFGFCDFAEDFTSRNPTKYIYPVRINGSAVETIFSQQKYVTAGKLTSLNYRTSRRALLIKGCTKTAQNAEATYRKVGVDL